MVYLRRRNSGYIDCIKFTELRFYKEWFLYQCTWACIMTVKKTGHFCFEGICFMYLKIEGCYSWWRKKLFYYLCRKRPVSPRHFSFGLEKLAEELVGVLQEVRKALGPLMSTIGLCNLLSTHVALVHSKCGFEENGSILQWIGWDKKAEA